jgi:hypothetical protein
MNRSDAQPVSMSDPAQDLQDLIAWEALAEPSRVFAHPDDVLAAANLSREEKRAILASWASNAWAVESAPALRHCPGLLGRYVPLDAVLGALRSLDPETADRSRSGMGHEAAAGRPRRIRWLTPRTSGAA